jgi:hypothetical protein
MWRSPSPEKIHVGRRVDAAERPVKFQGVRFRFHAHPAGRHHLDDVPGRDVPLGFLDGGDVTPSFRGVDGQRAAIGVQGGRQGRRRRAQAREAGREVAHGLAVDLFGRRPARHTHRAHEAQGVGHVVENEQVAGQEKNKVGKAQVVPGAGGQSLEMANDVVADETHGAPVEAGQSRDLGAPAVGEGLAQGFQRTDAGRVHDRRGRARPQDQSGLERRERVTPQMLAALHALQQETLGTATVKGVEQPEGRDLVRRALDGHGHDGVPRAQPLEFRQPGRDHRTRRPFTRSSGRNGVRSPSASFQSRLSPDSSRLSPRTTT